ncbi:MAG: hypothetical protein JWM33_396 [Caulobacteraceae bacterium]|nr:hypothetical protein [Caulobacteraceae bacterium]
MLYGMADQRKTVGPKGIFASLSPEKQAAVLAYRGPQDLGDPEFLMSKEPQPPPSTALALTTAEPVPLSRDIVKLIAMDIGKEVASHIETMYPAAVTATSKTMLLSVRNTVHNEIMAALGEVTEAAILARLERRRADRRRHRAVWRALRDQPITEDVTNDE